MKYRINYKIVKYSKQLLSNSNYRCVYVELTTAAPSATAFSEAVPSTSLSPFCV